MDKRKNLSDRCECVGATKNVKLVAPAGCAEDDVAVATLPDQWIPKHGGPLLAKYLKDREQNHERVLRNITEDTSKLNKDVESKIRTLSENLLAHIHENQRGLNCIIDKCELVVSPMSKETRDEALKQVSYLYNQQVDDIATFKREALCLERERAENIKILLREHFQRLIAVGHLPPKQLLHNFDERAYEINQQLLSNCRAFSDLEAQLRAQTDGCILHIRSILNQLSLGINRTTRGKSALPWLRQVRESQQNSTVALERTRSTSLPSIKEFLDNKEVFDECVALLVQAYRTAVIKVYTTFFGKFTELEKSLGFRQCFLVEDNLTSELNDIHIIIDKIVRSVSSSVYKKCMGTREVYQDVAADKLTMQKSLWSLGECLRDTYMILHDAGHLWDAHMLRLALAQKLTMAAVEDLLTNHDSIELSSEVTFNLALEQLRCASDVDKLQQHYEIIIAMLDHTAEMYVQHSETELGRLEEFMNLPTALVNLLLSEFNCFLEANPKVLLGPSGSMSSQHSVGSPRIGYSLRSPLPRAILQTELQELAISNWRNGFLESFERNMSLVPEELSHQARLWVEERAEMLHMRYSLKIVAHSIRAERLRAAYDVRLAELRYHESRLESHLNAVYRLVDQLPNDASEYLSLDAPQLYPFCKWINRIQSDMENLLAQDPLDPEVKKLKMNSYSPRLLRHRRIFEESLDGTIALYKRYLEHRVHEARISNVRFLSQITLFHEGGKYAAQEASKACVAIMKSSDALESCITRSVDALQHRRNQLLSQADQYMLPLQKVVDETVKSKGGMDRKKAPPVKKK
ncbi:hypothetical protein K1T71_011689 [Dendrolimus kikuchii]|uniref:Uncharacterized protein n=1 Tax=Dendrolimus kikuchii TaxID=765133 RepID=A0ACC1CLS6_9NEOP|nr:hypothetical protein K1T71_011689 [Dendrolimus kikuchii]